MMQGTNIDFKKVKEIEKENISYVRKAIYDKLSNYVIDKHMEQKSFKPIEIENIKDNEQVSLLSDAMFKC